MKIVSAADYDKRVISGGMQFQIDHYYVPVEAADRERIELVIRYLRPQKGDRILDLGCGVGTFAFHCARAGAHVVGMDYSFESLKAASVLCRQFKVQESTGFAAGRVDSIPFKTGVFNKIVAADFIEHITRQEKELLLEQLKYLLDKDGVCVIFTPNRIREDLAALYWRIWSFFTGRTPPMTELHFGLIDRWSFERMIYRYGFTCTFAYHDTVRPVLARIPVLRHILALNLLWVIRKDKRY
jgi:cyclopropane fatty-acyl-phospholipid synthase-like methyltransferase